MMANKYDIYLDNAATTKPDKEVVALYNEVELNTFGNSSSIHHLGILSNSLLNKAKESVLSYFKLNDHKVLFTSGATEANALAIKGYAFRYQGRGKHLITTNVEHPSVLNCFKQMEAFGFEVTYLEVNSKGIIEPEQLEKAMRNDTILVSIMAVNNEVGSINDIEALTSIVKKYPKARFLVDATQSIGKTNQSYKNIDMFTFSAHKIHGLKGSGALILRKNIDLLPNNPGGGQQEGLRPGTVSVGLACALAKTLTLTKTSNNAEELRNLLVSGLKQIKGIHINSDENCTPYVVNFSLLEKKASVVVEALSNLGIYVSSVSACFSKFEQSSYVVEAITHDSKLASNTIRVSFSNDSKIEDVEIFLKELKNILETIR